MYMVYGIWYITSASVEDGEVERGERGSWNHTYPRPLRLVLINHIS